MLNKSRVVLIGEEKFRGSLLSRTGKLHVKNTDNLIYKLVSYC